MAFLGKIERQVQGMHVIVVWREATWQGRPPRFRDLPAEALRLPQRAQYPLVKEYSLNHNMKPLMI